MEPNLINGYLASVWKYFKWNPTKELVHMAIYLYIPFSDSEDNKELMTAAQSWKSSYTRKQEEKEILSEDNDLWGQVNEINIAKFGDKQLKNLQPNDVIYVMGHAIEDKMTISNIDAPVFNVTTLSQKKNSLKE